MGVHPDWCQYECGGRGRCPHYGIFMAAGWVRLCLAREDYRQMWREGRGPGQVTATHTPVSVVAVEMPQNPAERAHGRENADPSRLDRLREELSGAIALQIDLGKAAVNQEEGERRAEICLTQCPKMGETVCNEVKGCCADTRRPLWIKRIVAGDCRPWNESPG